MRGRKKSSEPSIVKTFVLPLSLYKLVQEVAANENISDTDAIRMLIKKGYEKYDNEAMAKILEAEEKAET